MVAIPAVDRGNRWSAGEAGDTGYGRGIASHCLTTLLVGVLLLLCACSEHVPQLPALPADAVILAFGDSLTHGIGAGRGQSYPAELARLTGREVINAGMPGEISAMARTRLPGLLERHRPALLVLCHGGNDLLRRLDVRALRENLEAMILDAQSRAIPVVLLGVPEPHLFSLSTADLYAELAEQHTLVYEGEILAEVESDNRLKSDAIHPNAEGYRRIARAVHRTLRNSGALN
jgi:lysophospholipase L1-like esterase